MSKSRLYIYIVAGGYVAYTGLGLVKSALSERPGNYMLFLAIGILFIAFGGLTIGRSIQKLSKGDYAENTESTEEESGKDPDGDSDDR